MIEKYLKKWKKRIRRIKWTGAVLKQRKKLGTIAYSVIHLASGLKK